MTTAIIVGAGRGKRMGANFDKAFLSLGPRPLVAYSLMAYESCRDVRQIVLVVRRNRIEAAKSMALMFGISKLRAVVAGGTKRQDSVRKGLEALPPETRYVSIHDAARPLVTPELISETIKSAQKYGSGVAGRRIVDTVKLVEKTTVVSRTIDRSQLWTVQTPQTFQLELIQKAYEHLAETGADVTDDAAALEEIGETVRLVEWPHANLKVTVPEDLTVAASLLRI
ncbi:MAG: 2-C-methyl-D-erythritol 4-phosphate cytidylyltransferase [Lentisphaerae bacterium]|jgi:2-C-methyl-D-erythritol 4-phosphate cytidylyltransferase|nr:2-C-methyl-D-erythritol 4-phosphate cytidylyltransferase [Lentisphaerota bacterium]